MAWLIAFCIVTALVLMLWKRRLAGASIETVCFAGREILTDNEREFFHRVTRALPGFHVFPQVAANALLKVDKAVQHSKYNSVRNRFAQKHVDFIVCERETLRVLAIIELDDRTHRKEKDKARDAMFAQAGYVTHRFDSRQKPSEEAIAALFTPAVGHIEQQF